jgi:uncharacterized repeat protein (TIGR04076 family)
LHHRLVFFFLFGGVFFVKKIQAVARFGKILYLCSKLFLGVMAKVRITALRQTVYRDLMKKYENPLEHACTIKQGQQWISVDGKCPEGMCSSAWSSMQEFVEALSRGEGNFYDGWMRNPMSAMISCNDGFRPMTFYIELIEDSASQQASPEALPKHIQAPADKSQVRLHKLLLAMGDKTMPRRQIIAYLGLKQNSRCIFINNYLKPAMAKGYVVMARPASPNSPEQAYRLSSNGLDVWAQLVSDSQAKTK